MPLLAVLALAVTFVSALGAVVLISVDRAAALVDKPSMELFLTRK
ncbi:hypothetical protein [Aeromicrobium sp. UC242_57]